jgi:cellulose synthase/poly-beta-1,6-N-acetylglucosamine synthase-like glycosyltransferase
MAKYKTQPAPHLKRKTASRGSSPRGEKSRPASVVKRTAKSPAFRFSVIIPFRKSNRLLRENITYISNSSYKNFEIILLPDKKETISFPKVRIIPTGNVGPAEKRDIGAKQARGEILALLDDDSYPDKNWLKNSLSIFKEDKQIAGVCGPTLTPSSDNVAQKASGYVWLSWLGSGGAGTYRSTISPRRFVDDYPSVNFLVRKKDFLAVGGFNSHFWPGEDTKLCYDLIYKYNKKIIYDPKIIVYHHRREVFGPHLRQISRYAIHRGHFARIFPETSFRLGYLAPTIFVTGLLGGPILIFILELFQRCSFSIPLLLLYLASVSIYLLLLLLTAVQIHLKEKNLRLTLLVVPSIFLTHLIYGILFVKGFLSPRLER